MTGRWGGMLLCLLVFGWGVVARADPPASVLGRVEMNYARLDAMAALLEEMRESWPAGVEQVIQVRFLNTLVVKGTPEAVSQMLAFIRLLDRPRVQVTVEVLFVELRRDDVVALGFNDVSMGAFGLRLPETMRVGLDATLATGRGKMLSATRVLVPVGGQAEIDLDGYHYPMRRLRVTAVNVSPDGSVTMRFDPLFGPANAFLATGPVRVRNGETMQIGAFEGQTDRRDLLGPQPANLNTSAHEHSILVFLTPTIHIPDTTDFGAFAAPPPLF